MSEVSVEQVSFNPDIFKIYIPLPGNPLKNLNSYVLRTQEKSLVIDTGFNMQECREALLGGLEELGVDMRKAEIYATHLHSDHTGLISEIMRDDTIIYMSKLDYETMFKMFSSGWNLLEENMIQEGFPEEEVVANHDINPAKAYVSRKVFTPCFVDDGDQIHIGPFTLKVIYVPGHTPGNTCLYMEREKILFSGDHILFDISPNITRWLGMDDALGSYLDNLKRIRKLDIRLALPGHRNISTDVYKRIDQLLEHHDRRLEETLNVVKDHSGACAYEIAAHMKWAMRGKNWGEFPVQQKWFAVGETCSHLDYLLMRKKLERKRKGKVYRYYLSD